MLDTTLSGLHASPATPLPFAPALHIRAFTLERAAGNLLVYAAPEAEGPAVAQYLNHWHEAGFGGIVAPVAIHADDREEAGIPVARTFSERATLDGDFELIPTPGHTPGATAFLWDSGEQRYLFTGDSVYLRHGEWVAAFLDGSSDRAAYIASLELLRTLEFDVLVPWAATADGPWFAPATDAPARFASIAERLRRGEDH